MKNIEKITKNIKTLKCHTFSIYMVLNITFKFNNVLTHHFWSNEVDRQKKISQPFALIQNRVWTVSMFYYTFMEKFALMFLVVF